MIELKHLRTLRALADTGTLQQSAELLCITQSALSHQVKELEFKLGQPLFVRKTQPVMFSAAGQKLLQLATLVLPEVDKTVAELKQPAIQTVLRLCVECHACFHWLLPAVKQFEALGSHSRVEFVPLIEHNALDALLQHQLDIVLTSDKRMTQQISFFHLFDMELRLLVGPEHELANKPFISDTDLQRQSLISYPLPLSRLDVFRYFLAPDNFQGKVRQVDQASQILQLVAAGQGVSVLPSWMAQPYLQQGLLQSKALGEKGLWRPMYLACRRSEQENAEITLLIDSIQRCSPLR